MDTTTPIGLNAEAAAQLSAGLNDLLADLTVFYMNARGFHWNIRGKAFFELHAKFEGSFLFNAARLKPLVGKQLTYTCNPKKCAVRAQKIHECVAAPSESPCCRQMFLLYCHQNARLLLKMLLVALLSVSSTW